MVFGFWCMAQTSKLFLFGLSLYLLCTKVRRKPFAFALPPLTKSKCLWRSKCDDPSPRSRESRKPLLCESRPSFPTSHGEQLIDFPLDATQSSVTIFLEPGLYFHRPPTKNVLHLGPGQHRGLAQARCPATRRPRFVSPRVFADNRVIGRPRSGFPLYSTSIAFRYSPSLVHYRHCQNSPQCNHPPRSGHQYNALYRNQLVLAMGRSLLQETRVQARVYPGL